MMRSLIPAVLLLLASACIPIYPTGEPAVGPEAPSIAPEPVSPKTVPPRTASSKPVASATIAPRLAPKSASPAPGSPRSISLELYLVHELPAPNLVERRIEGSTEVLLLAPSPDLTERDVAYAEYDAAALKPRVILHLTPVGMDKLASLTQENIGRRLAIFIDGKHLATALIPGKMPDGRLSLMNFASPAEAQRVAGALARR